MSEWSDGYVTGVGYTYGCYPELNPIRERLCLLMAGVQPQPKRNVCELGFGQGVGINVLAAAQPEVRYWGTDFNPSQANFAREMMQASGVQADLRDAAFAEFCNDDSLPEFDSIGLHGIWSWVSDENKHVIVDFVRRKLKVGGTLYISYNTLPGWAPTVPLRHLMRQFAETMDAPSQDIISKVKDALGFMERMAAVNPRYMAANPTVAARLKSLHDQKANYLAHEYFNSNWSTVHFSEMAQWLAPAKLDFICSASTVDHIANLHMTTEQANFLQEIQDPVFRESVRDFMINRQFRKDYWVKGPRRLSGLEQIEQLRQLRVMLCMARTSIKLEISGALGTGQLSTAIYGPVLDALSEHKPVVVGKLESELKKQGLSLPQILEAIMVLVEKGDVAIVQDDELALAAKVRTDKLNHHLGRIARSHGDINFWASPVTGGAVPIGRFQQLFALAVREGRKTATELAQFVMHYLSFNSQKIVRDGKQLLTDEENLEELKRQAREFIEHQLPVIQALGMV